MARPTAYVDITKYEQKGVIGQGQFGNVYLYELKQGEVPDHGIRQVAVKEVYADEKNIDTVRKEVEIICQLKHPHIVQYLGDHVSGQHLQIMLEYMPGGSIDDHLKRSGSPFSEEKTKRYTRHVLEGLRYLHGMKTIHRDIKGANILIDGEDRAKVADFGLSKIVETNKSAHTFAGSPVFMSPEMILTNLDQTGHGLKTDIWSTGCVMVKMLTSYPPWKARCDARISRFKLMQLIAECKHPEYTLPDGVSEEARDFLNKCFVREPKDRPSADDLLRHPFLA